MANAQEEGFCSQCGSARPDTADYCPSCGQAFRNEPASTVKTKTVKRVTLQKRPQLAAVIMVGFMATGAALLWLGPGGSGDAARAVPGRPSTGAGPGAATPARQDLEFPEEITDFIKGLEQAAADAPNDAAAWQNLARAHFRASQLNRSYILAAENSLARLLEIDADNVEGLRMSGNLAYTKTDFATAQTYYEKYLELQPGDPHVLTDLGSVLLFQDAAERAKKIYTDVLEENPEFVQAHFNLAIALHAEGDSKGALERLKLAREYAPEPEYRERVDQYIRLVESGAAHGASGATAAAASSVPTDSTSQLQSRINRLFTEHRIVGGKVTSIEWHDENNASVYLDGFPMDKMPAVMRNKFKSTMNEQILSALEDDGRNATIVVKLVDKSNNAVMDTLDGEEFVGAFDEESYE